MTKSSQLLLDALPGREDADELIQVNSSRSLQFYFLYHLHNGLNRGIFEVSGGNCWLFLLPEV